MSNNDEKMTTNEILDIFSNKEERPSTEFEKNLKAECLKNFSAKKPNFILSIMEKSKKLLIAGGAFLVLLVAIGVPVTVITLKNRGNKDDVVDVNAKLAQTNLEELLMNAIKNNNGNLISKSSTRNQTAESGSGDMILAATEDSYDTMVGMPNNNMWTEFNYSYWKSTYTTGPAAKQCNLGWYDQVSDKIISEGYSFWENDDYSNTKSKSVSKTADGQLIEYSLFDGEKNFFYKGGDYAIVEKYNFPILYETEPQVGEENIEILYDEGEEAPDMVILPIDPETDTELDPQDIIEMYFGEDAELVNYELYNDEYHFVVQWKMTDYYCNDDQQVTVVNKAWIRESDFHWSKSETYLNSVSESNLMYRDENTSINKKVEFEEVKDNFNNDYSDVTVKEFEYDWNFNDTENQKAKMKEVLQENQVSIIIPKDTELGYMSSVKTYEDYIDPYYALICDRSFYPTGTFGDNSYKLSCEQTPRVWGEFEDVEYVYIEPEFEYSITTITDGTIDPESFNINIYSPDTKEEDLVKMHLTTKAYAEDEVEAEEVKLVGTQNLTIGGTSVTAKVYSQVTTYTYERDDKTTTDRTEGVLMIFSYNNKIYSVSSYIFNNETSAMDLIPTNFTAYNTANTTQRNSLFALLDKMYDRMEEDMVMYESNVR